MVLESKDEKVIVCRKLEETGIGSGDEEAS